MAGVIGSLRIQAAIDTGSLAASISTARGQLKGLDRNIAALGAAKGALGKGLMGRIGLTDFSKAGLGAAAGGLAAGGILTALDSVANAGSAAFGAMVDLEGSFGAVRKTTGMTGAEMAGLKSSLLDIGGAMGGVSIEELAEIASMAGRLGIQGQGDILQFTSAIAQIKIALDDIPVEESASSIARVLMQFGKGPKDALSFASALNKLDDSSTASGRDILDVSTRLSGYAATLGMSTEQVLALSATIKDAGIENEVGGTAFGQIMMKMATDAKKFAAVAGVGVEQFTTAGPLDQIKMLATGLKGLEATAGIRALEGLGLDGARASASLLQLSNVIGRVDGFLADANAESISHASILSEVAIKQEMFGTQTSRFTNVLKGLATTIGDEVLPPLTTMLSLMTDATRMVVAGKDAALPGLARVGAGALGGPLGAMGMGAWQALDWTGLPGMAMDALGLGGESPAARVAAEMPRVEAAAQQAQAAVDATTLATRRAASEFVNLTAEARTGFDSVKLGSSGVEDVVAGMEREIASFNLGDRDRTLADMMEGSFSFGEMAKLTTLTEQLKEMDALKDLKDKGRGVAEQFRTPQQSLDARMAELRDMLDAGAIDEGTYGRAAQDARKQFRRDSAGGMGGGSPFAGAMELGSKEARTAILSARGLQDGNRGMKDLVGSSKRQEGHLSVMAKALTRGIPSAPSAGPTLVPSNF